MLRRTYILALGALLAVCFVGGCSPTPIPIPLVDGGMGTGDSGVSDIGPGPPPGDSGTVVITCTVAGLVTFR